MSVAEKAARGAAWNLVTGVGSRAIGLVGTLVLTRFIAPAEFGEVSAASVCVVTAATISHARLGQYVIAKRANAEATYLATVVHVALGVAAVAIVYLLRSGLGQLLDAPNMARFVPGLALAAIIERVSYIPDRTLVRELRFREVSVARSMGELAYTAVSLALAPWLGGMAVVLGSIARSVLATGLILRWARWADWGVRVPFRWSVIREMLGYTLPLSIGGLAEYGSTRWDNLLVSRFFGPRQLGMYNLAYNLAETPQGNVGDAINDVLLPSFAKLSPEKRKDALLRGTQLMALVVFPLSIGLAATAPTVVRVLFDRRWLDVAPMLAILSALFVARPVSWPVISFMQAQHRPNVIMWLGLLKVVLLLGAIAVFGRSGPLSTCVAVGATFVLHALGYLFLAWLLEGVPSMRLLGSLLPMLGACAVMWLGVAGVRVALRDAGLDASWLSLILEILAGGVIYVVAGYLLARRTADELIRQTRRAIQKRRRRGEGESDAAPESA